MVAAARKERETAEKRNEQLRSQLNETEILLASHQEQLAELKSVMQSISERGDADSNANTSTAPPTPAMQNQEHLNRAMDSLHISTEISGEDISPAPPTSFTHLLSPVLRTDLVVYEDFRTLLEMTRKSSPSSRVTSGAYGGLSLAGLANAHREQMQHTLGNGSTSSLSTSTTYQSSPGTPSTPATSTNSSVSSRDVPTSSTPLKETRFYKRVLVEDIEPTLRLDAAPGLSWLARRSVINSMCDGSLVVEPIPNSPTLRHFACSLCGENRKGEDYKRIHRFRTSDNDNAQRYPLCDYCLNRIRSTCDFLGFLRMIKDGHWRTDGEQAEATAWEESVRLREHMFWARIGGGVVPTSVRARDSPRSSVEEKAASPAAEPERNSLEEYLNVEKPHSSKDDNPFVAEDRRPSLNSISSSYSEERLGVHSPSDQLKEDSPPSAAVGPELSEDEASKQLHVNLEAAVNSQDSQNQASELVAPQNVDQPQSQGETESRHSVTMPGAFEF